MANYVYILASKKNGTLYIGNTHDLKKRVWEHKTGHLKGFTSRYKVHMLVYYAHFENKWDAADYERKLKNWRRQWKIDLIQEKNPEWTDLYESI